MGAIYDQDDNYSLNRLRNITGVAEGTSLPPKQVGQFRVPFITNLKTARAQKSGTNTKFTLTWSDPLLPNIANFAIYINDAANLNQSPTGPYIAPTSPVQIVVPTSLASTVVFRVQTVLKNGFVSDFDAAPTCTGKTIA